MNRLRRAWSAFLDWCNPDRYLCSFPNETNEEGDA